MANKTNINEILKDIPVTNITMVADMSDYDQSLKKYLPDSYLREVFKEVYEKSDLEFNEIDEIRKVYFTYFKCYIEELSNYNLVKIKIPTIGFVSPNINDYVKYMERFSKGLVHTYFPHKEIVIIYNKLLTMLNYFVDNYKLLYSDFKEEYKYERNFVANKNKEFKCNFKARHIRFKETIISRGVLFD